MYLSGSSPKMVPKTPGEAAYMAQQAAKSPPEEDIPEITVTGTRIQWWQWLLGGAALAGIAAYFTRR